MFSPLTRILVKIFAHGFYKVHSGLLLFFFVSIALYFLFITVLNETHVPPADRILYNLILVLTIISSPGMMILLFILWLFYTVKSWNYVRGEFLIPHNQFLFYTSTAFSKARQFRSWFIVQLIIFLPFIAYGLFSVVVGIVFQYYVLPWIILLYVLFLASVSALLYVWYSNTLNDPGSSSYLTRILGSWKKPFFSLFLFQAIHQQKITLVITKLLSWAVITAGIFLFPDEHDFRIAGIITLGITTTHALLVYQSCHFEFTQLSLSRNLPYSRTRLFLDSTIVYLLLTLPENCWLLFHFLPKESIVLLAFHTGTAMLFRGLIYHTGLDIKRFLSWTFYLFILFFLAILFGLLLPVTPVILLISIAIFFKYYYKPAFS